MKTITAKHSQPLHIGMQGEHLACEVHFPEALLWREEYGDGVFSLWHRRPGETAAYPCVLHEENGSPVWSVTQSDTQIASTLHTTGFAELQYTVGERIVRSCVYATVIHASITGETMDAPDPAQTWVNSVLQAAERVSQTETRLNEKIGDVGNVESALDGIIALQNSYIGGGEA